MNTRLQVEHPVTEMVAKVDLVHQQFEIAQGKSIQRLPVKTDGHAIEVRINAERVEIDEEGNLRFIPEPGHVNDTVFPEDPFVRVISAYGAGSLVSPYYDSMIAQVICWGRSRKEACARLQEYLGRVKIHGVSTSLALSRAILGDSEFQKGRYDTGFLKGLLDRIDTEKLQHQIEENSGDSRISIDQDLLHISESNEIKVIAPQMGGFYRSSSPDEEPFVEEGQVVDIQQTLCLMESMKIFSELNLAHFKDSEGQFLYDQDQRYRVNRVIAEDRQTVNEGDLLFVLQAVEADPAVVN